MGGLVREDEVGYKDAPEGTTEEEKIGWKFTSSGSPVVGGSGQGVLSQ